MHFRAGKCTPNGRNGQKNSYSKTLCRYIALSRCPQPQSTAILKLMTRIVAQAPQVKHFSRPFDRGITARGRGDIVEITARPTYRSRNPQMDGQNSKEGSSRAETECRIPQYVPLPRRFRISSGSISEKTYDISALFICVRDRRIDEFWHAQRRR